MSGLVLTARLWELPWMATARLLARERGKLILMLLLLEAVSLRKHRE